jgi:hypothetical protein
VPNGKCRRVLLECLFAEFNLHDFEITFSYIKQYNCQITFLCIGLFKADLFTPVDQYRLNIPRPGQKWLHQKQLGFSRKLASVLPLQIDDEEVYVDDGLPSSDKAYNAPVSIDCSKDEPSIENLKMLLKNNFLPLF